MNFFRNGKLDEANEPIKAIKKEIRKSAQSYYKNKVKKLFYQYTTKLVFRGKKKLCSGSLDQRYFNLPESPEVTADNLNKFLASIVKSLPAMSYQLPTDVFFDSFREYYNIFIRQIMHKQVP